MTQPEDFIDSKHPNYVCKLEKSIYGLKQAPRSWYNRINEVLEKLSFRRTNADNGVYVGKVNHARVLVALYVDDIVILLPRTRSLQHQVQPSPFPLSFWFVLFKLLLNFVPNNVLDRRCESPPTPGSPYPTVKGTISFHV